MSITVTSTTDSKEAVAEATGDLREKKSVEEKKSAPAVEPGETIDEDSETSDATDGEELEATDGDKDSLESEDPKPKKKSGFKRRIDKLNSKLSAAEQEREYWRQEALKTQRPPEKQSSEVTPPNPDDRPKSDNYDSHEDYVEALTEWKVERKLSAREMKAKEDSVKTEVQAKITAHVERVKEFSEAHEDFQELMEDVDDIPMSLTVQEVILGSEIGPELMYELAKNRDEYARICKLPAIAAARELGKFEAKISGNKESSKEQTEVKKTKAPPPISPVGSKTSGASRKAPDEMSYQEYKRWRAAHPNG